MSLPVFTQRLDLAVFAALVVAVMTLWRRSVPAAVRLLAVQGAALAGVATLLAVHSRRLDGLIAAALILVVKTVAVPTVLMRVAGSTAEARETRPLVNVPASLVAASLLSLIAYAATARLVSLSASPEVRALPVGFAIVLIGSFSLATRRNAIAQVAGFLVMENGVALVALLATAGVPLLVELGVSLDVLLAALVLQVLASRMRSKFGGMDLGELTELHD